MKESNKGLKVYNSSSIQKKIFNIRNVQVIVDSDLAMFYNVETKQLNRAVKRNIERFPKEFMFQLTKEEWESLRFQFGTLNNDLYINEKKENQITMPVEGGKGKHRKYVPYVFTEQGVAMLSGVLRSETAVRVSIQIINAFVTMRRFLTYNAQLFQRIDSIERRQIKYEMVTDKKLAEILDKLQSDKLEPKQGIFFDGQIFDAYKFVSSLIRKAESSILLIDNYIDETILELFTKKKRNVEVTILTRNFNKTLRLDKMKFDAQYPSIKIKEFKKAHDRFLILDWKEVYHFGASLKDLGKKWFAFSKLDISAIEILNNIRNILLE